MVMIDPRVVLIVVSVLIIYVYCIYLLKLAEWKYDLIHLKTFPTALITASKCAFCDKSVQRTAPLLYIMMKQQIIKGGSPITDYHVHIFAGHDHQWRNEWKIDILVYYQPSPEKSCGSEVIIYQVLCKSFPIISLQHFLLLHKQHHFFIIRRPIQWRILLFSSRLTFFLGPSGGQAMHCTWYYSYEDVLKGDNNMQLYEF